MSAASRILPPQSNFSPTEESARSDRRNSGLSPLLDICLEASVLLYPKLNGRIAGADQRLSRLPHKLCRHRLRHLIDERTDLSATHKGSIPRPKIRTPSDFLFSLTHRRERARFRGRFQQFISAIQFHKFTKSPQFRNRIPLKGFVADGDHS